MSNKLGNDVYTIDATDSDIEARTAGRSQVMARTPPQRSPCSSPSRADPDSAVQEDKQDSQATKTPADKHLNKDPAQGNPEDVIDSYLTGQEEDSEPNRATQETTDEPATRNEQRPEATAMPPPRAALVPRGKTVRKSGETQETADLARDLEADTETDQDGDARNSKKTTTTRPRKAQRRMSTRNNPTPAQDSTDAECEDTTQNEDESEDTFVAKDKASKRKNRSSDPEPLEALQEAKKTKTGAAPKRLGVYNTLIETLKNNTEERKLTDEEIADLLSTRTKTNDAKVIINHIKTQEREIEAMKKAEATNLKLTQEVQKLKKQIRALETSTGEDKLHLSEESEARIIRALTGYIDARFQSEFEFVIRNENSGMVVPNTKPGKKETATQSRPKRARKPKTQPPAREDQEEERQTTDIPMETDAEADPPCREGQGQTNPPPKEEWATVVREKAKKAKPAPLTNPEAKPATQTASGGIRALHAMIPALQKRKKRPTWARITAKGQPENSIEALQTKFDPAKEGIQIASAIRRPEARQLLIRAETEQDLAKLRDSKLLLEGGYEVEQLMEKNPKIIIYDVDSSLTKEQLANEIRNKNELLQEATEADFRLLYQIQKGPKDRVHWVAETSPHLRSTIMGSQGKKIKISWARLRVDDFLDAPRCFKCQRYGHVAKHCTHKAITCGHCGKEGHKYSECLARDKPPVCTPCKLAKRNHTHSIQDKHCPSKLQAIKERMRKTAYGSAQ